MSAGGLSYSGLRTYGKVGLPSVEGGFGTLNILKDPPKSLWTRRIDKVGQTSDITETIDASGNRACEMITAFPRGVNPMVAVDYSNYGRNGGQQPCNPNSIHQSQAYLPYRVARDGAFYPPIIDPRQLMPLSRQPRAFTSTVTNPCVVDFCKGRVQCPSATKLRQITQPVHFCVTPNKVMVRETPAQETYEVKNVIQNPVQVSANSGVRTLDITQATPGQVAGRIREDYTQIPAHTNLGSGGTVSYFQNSDMNTERYLQEPNTASANAGIYMQRESAQSNVSPKLQNPVHATAFANPTSDMQVTPLENMMDVQIRTKDPLHTSHSAGARGTERMNYIHEDLELQRNMPVGEIRTNHAMNIHHEPTTRYQQELERKMPVHGVHASRGFAHQTEDNRDIRLRNRLDVGGFHAQGAVPQADYYGGYAPNIESTRNQVGRRAASMHLERYANPQ